MMAASGSTRPGETSRSPGLWSSRAYQSPRTTAWARRERSLCTPEVRRHGSTRGAGGPAAATAANSSRAQPSLPCPCRSAARASRTLEQELHVQRGVGEPRRRHGPGRPVDRRVLLGQPDAEVVLGDGGQADPGQPGQACAQLGVEHRPGPQAELGQARQVLGGGVQHPLGPVEDVGQAGQVEAGDRVQQHDGAVGPAQLDQVGGLPVAVAGRALGVDGDRALGGPQVLDRGVEGGLGGDDVGRAVARGVRTATGGALLDRLGRGLLDGIGHARQRRRRRCRAAGTDAARRLRSAAPARMAMATISARSPVPSLRAMRARWLLTVRADSPRDSPTSLLERPSATRASTSTSRADSWSTPGSETALGPAGAPLGRLVTRKQRAPAIRAPRTVKGSVDCESSTVRVQPIERSVSTAGDAGAVGQLALHDGERGGGAAAERARLAAQADGDDVGGAEGGEHPGQRLAQAGGARDDSSVEPPAGEGDPSPVGDHGGHACLLVRREGQLLAGQPIGRHGTRLEAGCTLCGSWDRRSGDSSSPDGAGAAVGQRRRGRALTRLGSGGRPARRHSTDAQAPSWASIGPSGVHDARSSTWIAAGRSAREPKLSETTRVTVPPSRWAGTSGGDERLAEPRPHHLGQHRVLGQLGLHDGLDQGDHPQVAAPGLGGRRGRAAGRSDHRPRRPRRPRRGARGPRPARR